MREVVALKERDSREGAAERRSLREWAGMEVEFKESSVREPATMGRCR
jgi:hypothetical protein